MLVPIKPQDSETAFAKVNLALHVRRRRDDGYHELETLFAFVDSGDVMNVGPSNRMALDIDGPFGSRLDGGGDNLVCQAALALKNHTSSIAGGALSLTKNLPVASGIGGGSADAAAALRLLNRFWGCGLTNQELRLIAEPLGADIPACVASRAVIGRGIGQRLQQVDFSSLEGCYILLANPGVPVSTVEVFRGWDGTDLGPLPDGDAKTILTCGRNDLERSATNICPAISDVLAMLEANGAVISRMSGSGATCFGIFNSFTAMAFAEMAIRHSHADWWTMSGRLR